MTISNAVEDVKKLDLSHIVVGIENGKDTQNSLAGKKKLKTYN